MADLNVEKIELRKQIISAANIYKTNLAGKVFLYVYGDKYFEVAYMTEWPKTLESFGRIFPIFPWCKLFIHKTYLLVICNIFLVLRRVRLMNRHKYFMGTLCAIGLAQPPSAYPRRLPGHRGVHSVFHSVEVVPILAKNIRHQAENELK